MDFSQLRVDSGMKISNLSTYIPLQEISKKAGVQDKVLCAI